jgi:drug/metabolite transporter (DMT)-like permease
MKATSSPKPLIELFIASIFWGFGYVATIWTLETLHFPAVVFYRFSIAFLIGVLTWFTFRPTFAKLKFDFELSFRAGFWLSATLLLQTWGLVYTTATNSAFITSLYVVFVPLLAALVDREKLSLRTAFACVQAFCGMALIVDIQEIEGINFGDLLTLLGAFTAAFHIRAIDQAAHRAKSSFNFNLFQCLWTSLFCVPLMTLAWSNPKIFTGSFNLLDLSNLGWIGLMALILGSTLLAFFLQIRAQKILHPTIASIFFLLESPLGLAFGFLLLQETLQPLQFVGAALIFVSCSLVSLWPEKKLR